MSNYLITILLALLFLSIAPQKSDGEYDQQWCIADEQTPDAELQAALDWACGKGGADCSQIQVNKPCYLPNTVRDHASYAFNSYFQKFKHKGGSCYFKGAALITELDPKTRSIDECPVYESPFFVITHATMSFFTDSTKIMVQNTQSMI